MGLELLKTLVRAAPGECLLRAPDRDHAPECLDRVIPLGERHLRRILSAWVAHYNGGRPPASLGRHSGRQRQIRLASGLIGIAFQLATV